MTSENTAETIHVMVDVDLDEVRQWAEKFADSGQQGLAHVMFEFRDNHKPKSMAGVEWDDAVHHLAEADAGAHYGNVVMLEPYQSKHGRFIRCLMPDSPYQNKVDGLVTSSLTPTGNRFKLVPAGWEGINGPFPDRQPGTTEPVDDVERGSNPQVNLDSSEPKPGEAWLVDRKYSHMIRAEHGWHGQHGYYDDAHNNIVQLHRLGPVVEPRKLATEQEYRDAPAGTVAAVAETNYFIFKEINGRWKTDKHDEWEPRDARYTVLRWGWGGYR